MKILMQNRIDAFSLPGGDTVQMLKTKEYLEKLGVVVDISLDLEPDLRQYDIVHLFNITRVHETYIQYLNAKKQKVPIALSTIYQNFDELDIKGTFGLKRFVWRRLNQEAREKLKTALRVFFDPRQLKTAYQQLLIGFRRQQKEVLEGTTMILPNSTLENEAIRKDFGINFDYEIIPNAVDSSFIRQENTFDEKMVKREYVLCVGNYIERKNQLALLKALEKEDIPLVFIGGVTNSHRHYYRKICRLAAQRKANTKVLQKVKQDELIPLYLGAKVIALPSWIETTGLSCLEGALTGSNVVVTDLGYAKEYFGKMACYCNPNDIGSIRKAVLKAYELPTNPNLRAHILENYTWDKTAMATLKAYKKVLVEQK